ncbi:hypothetical protein [Bdellovibrio bacteriovorus]|uniref:hypothetical protein n=1 Tax=Bdellovibrio TaxID=958 RepID=UPI0035A8EC64
MIQSFYRTYRWLISLVIVLSCTGCTLEAILERGESSSELIDAIPLVLTVDVGAAKTIEPLGGTPPYTYSSAASGFLDTSTGLYSVPVNAQVSEEVIEVKDSAGKTFAVTVRRKGFREFRRIEMPQSAQDQNFVSDAVWLASGKVLTTAVASDNSGERWATYRSSDDGVSWTRVDHFMGFHYFGESHPLAMAAKGSTVFVCGYGYSYNATASDPNSAWFVRKSTDEGTTWTTSDEWWEIAGNDHVCYDIAVSPTTGFIYAVGYSDTVSGMAWTIRESQDDGVTWTTIYQTAPQAGGYENLAAQIDISPSGHLFVMGKTGASNNMYFLKGTFSMGTWSWTPATTIPAVVPFGTYELRGSLQVIDDNTAFYSCGVDFGKVYRTLDAGVTWTQVYSGQKYLQGMTLTASGTLIAVGGDRTVSPRDWKVVSSSDGTTWTATDLDATLSPPKNPYGVTIVSHPSNNKVLAFSSNQQDYQSAVAYSADAGASWSLLGEVRFEWAFWSSVRKVIRTSPSTLYAIFDTGDMEGDWPWVISKSTDNGVTWQDSDRFKTVADDTYVADLLQGHDGAIYAVGMKDGNKIIRRTTDGVTWSEVYSTGGSWGSMFLAKRNTSETYFVSDDGANIQVAKTTDGVTWSVVKTFATPGGVTDIELKSFMVDSAGYLHVSLLERINAAGTLVIYRSTDGGGNWTETFRSSSFPSYWDISGSLRLSPDGGIFVIESTSSLPLNSVDNGATWSSYASAPSNVLDVGWSDSTAYFMIQDPTLGTVVVTQGATPGTWTVVESQSQRETVGDSVGEYEMELVTNKFMNLGPSELLLNYTYNDAYLGSRTILRVLDSSQ